MQTASKFVKIVAISGNTTFGGTDICPSIMDIVFILPAYGIAVQL